MNDYRMADGARAAARALKSQGVPLPSHPEEGAIPGIPRDLTGVDDESLMGLFAELVGWADYTNVQLAVAEVDERSAQKALSGTENVMLVQLTTQAARGDRVTLLKAKIAADPEVQTLSREVDNIYAYRKLIESISANLERDISLVSRELTRRTSHGPQKRAGRFTP